MTMIERLAETSGVASNVLYALIGVFTVLILATGIVALIERKRAPGDYSELTLRVRSWWFMIAVFSIAMLSFREISSIFLGLISFLALKEYLSLIPTRRIDRWVLFWAYLAIPIQFYWAHIGWYGMFIVFIPVWMFLFFPMVMAFRGETDGFLRAVGTLSWGLMMTVFTLSHSAFILSMDQLNPVAGGAGLLLFVVILTQFNDVAQFTWGKLFGRRKIVPSVSPNKTWEGFLGGLATTILAAALIGPFLTPMPWLWSAAAGGVVALAGFVGDVTISAVKRDLKVKDASHMIPGHGGVLDRVDSLTYAAPVFFHFFWFFFG